MKKKLGQNFLRNKDISKRIVDLSNIPDDVEVIEIGPGDGSLTDNLINLSNNLLLLEFDNDLIQPLRNKYESSNISILNADARTYCVPDNKKYFVIGNLQYYAANIIIRNFLYQKNIQSMVFTVQKEVGEQIVAPDGKKSYLSFLIQSVAQVEKLLIIKNKEFYPVPKVDSMTVKITPVGIEKNDEYTNFVRKCFSNPRKKITNSFSRGLELDNEITKTIIHESLIDENLRPQHLKLDDWQRLYEVYLNYV